MAGATPVLSLVDEVSPAATARRTPAATHCGDGREMLARATATHSLVVAAAASRNRRRVSRLGVPRRERRTRVRRRHRRVNAARVVEREREHARASKAEVSQRRHGKRSAARARGGTRGGDGGGEETKRRRDDGRGIDGESLARRGLGARERGVRQGASKREFSVGMPPGQVAHDVAGGRAPSGRSGALAASPP